MLLEVKIYASEQEKALKDTLFLIHFIVQSLKVFKKQFKKTSHEGVAKVLFE